MSFSFSSFTINNREFSTSLDLESELNFEAEKNYLFDLSYLSVIDIAGEKAQEFLQGQLSCDLRQVNTSTVRQGAMCNLKGRILALMDVVDWQGLKLVLPNDLIEATQISLNKVAMLSRVKLELKNSFQIYGFFLANPNDLLPANLSLPEEPLKLSANSEACCYSLSKQLFIILIHKDQEATLTQSFSSKHQLRGSLAWHQLKLKRKSIEIYPKTRGFFLPHRIELHLSGYLNFDKGCYKGQEIVARTHFRAKLKHSLELFTIETTEPLNAGAKLFSSNQETEVGELIDYSPLGKNHYLIAVSILFNPPKEVFIEGQAKPVELITA
ncbi:MAG: folate-binding protein YgfZ [Tatlockia sp.]|nr:folate-binding protein YgfZ [Tatlockia sp.]